MMVNGKIEGALAAVPSFGKLLYRLARDPRVPTKNKMIFLGAAAYLLLPFDIVPDWIPGVGRVDDVVLVVLALDLMINQVPDHVVYEHWDASPEILSTVQRVLSTATAFVPEKLKRAISEEEEEDSFQFET